MRYIFGNDYFEARQGRNAPICFDAGRLINSHVLIVGSSGVGKSHTIRAMLAQGVRTAPQVRFHVFDVHGDLEVPGASVAAFSEQAPFGLNPLIVNPDRDFGGVRKAIQAFLRTVNLASTTALGVKQESVLRNLLLDVYRDFGFEPERPETWSVNEYATHLVSGLSDNRLYLVVPIAEKDEAKAYGARWDAEKRLWWVRTENYKGELKRWPPAFKARSYPTVADVAAYARRLHEERFLGSDQKAVAALARVNKAARGLQRKFLESIRSRNQDDFDDEAEEALEAAREKALAAYEEYVKSIRTGREFESLLKYDSPDVLKSVVDRLGNLQSTGIFRAERPPFEAERPVWRYKLNALSHEEKKMLVLFLLQDIFNAAVQRGEQSTLVDVVVLDELGTYLSSQDENGDGIIGTIAREARKFGLALWAANQTPNVPESLLSSVGTKVVLGLDEMYWNAAVSKLRMDAKLLAWIQPMHTLAVQMKERGALKNRWWWVQL